MANKLRYDSDRKRILKIGNSLAVSLDEYQLNKPLDKRFQIGDMVYIRIEKEDAIYSGAARVNSYGSTYVVYLNSRWNIKASDIIKFSCEKMED